MMKKLLINIIAAAAMLVPLSLSAQDTRVQESRKAKLEKEIALIDKQLKENGFNSQSFLSWAKQKNLIETDGERFTKKKKIQSIATNCVCILYNFE